MSKSKNIFSLACFFVLCQGSFQILPADVKRYIFITHLPYCDRFPWQKLAICLELKVVCKEWAELLEPEYLREIFSNQHHCYDLCRGNLLGIIDFYLPNNSRNLFCKSAEEYHPLAYTVGSGNYRSLKLFRAICGYSGAFSNWSGFGKYIPLNREKEIRKNFFLKSCDSSTFDEKRPSGWMLAQTDFTEEAQNALYALARMPAALFNKKYYENLFNCWKIFRLHRFLAKYSLFKFFFDGVSESKYRNLSSDFFSRYSYVKVDCNMLTPDGKTLLICLIERYPRRLDLLDSLIERGASINKTDFFGKSPLWYAIRNCNKPAIDFLLSKKELDLGWTDPKTNNSYAHCFVLFRLFGYIENIVELCAQRSVAPSKNREGLTYDQLPEFRKFNNK